MLESPQTKDLYSLIVDTTYELVAELMVSESNGVNRNLHHRYSTKLGEGEVWVVLALWQPTQRLILDVEVHTDTGDIIILARGHAFLSDDTRVLLSYKLSDAAALALRVVKRDLKKSERGESHV